MKRFKMKFLQSFSCIPFLDLCLNILLSTLTVRLFSRVEVKFHSHVEQLVRVTALCEINFRFLNS